MSKLIALDDGHGMSTAGKRTPIFTDGTKSPETGKNFMHENEFNRAVVKYVDIELKRCGFRTLLVAPTDADTPLSERVAIANNARADAYVSVHANALKGVWGTHGGAETFTYGLSGNSYILGKIIHKHMMKGTPIRDRGVKDGSWLYVVKNTNMIAVLIEAGFMDNLSEAKMLLSDAFRRETAREIAMGLCEYYKVAYVPEKTTNATGQWYRVRLAWTDPKSQEGAFQELHRAKTLADSLKAKGDYKVFDEKGTMIYDPTPEKDDDVWYRVRKTWEDAKTQAGAFHELEGAKAKADELAKEGYKVFDESGKVIYTPTIVENNEWYRVRVSWDKPESQIGAFKELDGAKLKADQHAIDGYKVFDDNGKVVYTPTVTPEVPEPTPAPQPEPVNPCEGHHDIVGKSEISAEKMVAFVKNVNPNAQDIEEIAKQFLIFGDKYGIRGDIALCQSIIETGWFKFDGGTAVTPDQHNYCGMGVTSKGLKGNSFATVADGVGAQIQHLFAYATKDALPEGEPTRSPRMKYVTRGIAPHWEDLSMRWAMNENYGKHILSVYDKLVAFEYVPPVIPEPIPEPPIVEQPPIEEPIPAPQPEPIPEPTPEEPVETPTPAPTPEDKKVSMWVKIIDYIFKKISQLFGKK